MLLRLCFPIDSSYSMLYIIVIWVSESSISSALFAFVSLYHFFVLIEYQCIASSLR